MQPRSHRWIATSALVALVALSLTACGAVRASRVHRGADSADQASDVHCSPLHPTDLGRGFVLDRSKDADGNDIDEMGCLATISTRQATTGSGSGGRGEVQAGRQDPVPGSADQHGFIRRQRSDGESLGAFREVFETCDNLKFKDDGITFDIPISTDNVPSNSAIDEQVNVRGVGTVTAKKVNVPFGIWISMARAGNQGSSSW